MRNTLTKVYEQDYKNIEVIVVDNASSDGSPEMVANEFPTVILIRMQKNIGIAGWNEGFKIAKGEYVLVLDDDSYPLNSTIFSGLREFLNKDIAIVALRIFNNYLNRNETEWMEFSCNSFIGCGALIKKDIFNKVGYYSADIFLYHNELDLSIKIIDTGFKIAYAKESIIIHQMSNSHRGKLTDNKLTSKRSYYWVFVSHSVFLIHNFSFLTGIKIFGKLFINRLIIALIFNYWTEFLSALATIMKRFNHFRLERRVVSSKTELLYTKIIPFVDRDFFPNFKKPSLFK
ncbi:MAG: glycosyltransferase [Ignavibacteriaceae bacterium]|nr:glycosyltransferase [Ignavibacteriaceae bacterium]